MNVKPTNRVRRQTNQKWGRLLVVLLGIVVGQFILYGPSLVGSKILLPLDILQMPGVYTPNSPDVAPPRPHDFILADLVTEFETQRQFANAEIRAGRFPMWAPYQYAGAPVVWPKFSPFLMAAYLVKSPVILAWVQLMAALIAGLGFYLFCRRAMGISFWPAAIVAWCYPLTGFFILWEGYSTALSVYWLPWSLLAVDGVARRGGIPAMVRLSVVTCLVLVSGHVDMAAQVLLVSGLYAVWCLFDTPRHGQWLRQTGIAVATLAIAWLIGLCLASPALLPLFEYAPTGARTEHRSAGNEERPPAGLSALPQVILPDMYGRHQLYSMRIVEGNQTESSAAAYAGMLATLFAAPLAWCSRRHRSFNIFWSLLGFFALSWCLNVPGLVAFLRLPGLNLMSHNRLVFALAFAILALAATGLDVLQRGQIKFEWWFWIPIALLLVVLALCIHNALHLPEPIYSQLKTAVDDGYRDQSLQSPDDVPLVQSWFTCSYLTSAALCAFTLAAWVLLKVQPTFFTKTVPGLGIFLAGDLLLFAHDQSAQCDPRSYYPRIPVLEEVSKSVPGRVMGYGCLQATLAEACGLNDVRGYDSIDPKRLVDLLAIAIDERSEKLDYAMTQLALPQIDLQPPDNLRLSPVLDMLDVRYIIFRRKPPENIHPSFQGDDYWVMINQNALPRAFVPEQVETVHDDAECLKELASPQFDPRKVAYTTSPVDLPASCRGTVEISSEIPTRINLSVKMETRGVVVLADLWDKGWHATLNGDPTTILRVNNALRGVVVPQGNSTLEFYYKPASFVHGLQLSAGAMTILIVLSVINRRRKKFS